MDSSTEKKILKFSLITPKHSEKEEPKAPFHTTAWRWLALLLMNLLLLGDYVVIDSPQALETQLEETLDLTKQQYSYLYSSWALPSIVIPFIGGYLTDYLGVRPTLVLSCVILSIGQLVYWLGADATNFACMLVGRAIYALGSNPLNVAQIVIIYKWFNGREIALAMSISSTTSCIGRALNSFVIPKIYVKYGTISAPILFGFLICVFSTIICIIMVIWDKINDKREHDLDPDYPEEIENPEKISLKDVRYFKLAVWLLVLNFGLTDGYFFSFNAFSNEFYHSRYKFSNSTAGNIISVNYIMGAISSVGFGLIIDKKGYRASIILWTSLLGVAGFLYYLIFPDCPECITTVIPQIFFGLLIGINDAAVFPSLPLVLEEKYLGTGFGLFFVFQNLLIFILPPISAYITDITSSVQNGFFWMLAFYLGLAILTSLESFALLVQDKKLGRVLDTFVTSEEDEEDIEEEEGEEIEDEEEEDVKEEEQETNDNEKIDIPLGSRTTQISTHNEP